MNFSTSESAITSSLMAQTRRAFLGQGATGLGAAALAALQSSAHGATSATQQSSSGKPQAIPGLADLPHFAPRAKRVIYLFQNGAPTHVDLFDYKPELQARHGQPVPESAVAGRRFSTMTGDPNGKLLLAPIEPFHQRGECGAWVSDLMPYTAQIVDRLCFVRSMHTEAVNHAPAISFLLSGSQIPGRPTFGAWTNYGLGCETDSLPAFVVMTSVTKNTTCGQIFYDFYWGSGFLPSKFQGVKFRSSGQPVLYLEDPPGIDRSTRRAMLDDLQQLNSLKLDSLGDPEIGTRIAQFEMAYRMQTSVPDLADLRDESQETLDLYGPDVLEPDSFAHHCLMARRLVERGVSFVQLMHAGWDQHRSLTTELYSQCRDTDRASAALVLDLERRGLLDDTLVIWGGEFGRTPFLQGDLNNRPQWGRDHHPYAFTVWMAGGGVRPGLSYGNSDELGMVAVENPVHVHDLQATWMRLLGIDHERLTFRFQGRNFRLTDIHGKVVEELIA